MACYNENDPYNKALVAFVGEETAKRHIEKNGGHPLNLDAEGNPDKFFDDVVKLTGKTHAGFMAKMGESRDMLDTLEKINQQDRSITYDIYDVMKHDGSGIPEVDGKIYANFKTKDINEVKKYLPELKESDNFEQVIKDLPLNPAYEVMRQQRNRDKIIDDVRISNQYSNKFKC